METADFEHSRKVICRQSIQKVYGNGAGKSPQWMYPGIRNRIAIKMPDERRHLRRENSDPYADTVARRNARHKRYLHNESLVV